MKYSHFDNILANDTHPLHDRLIFNANSRTSSRARSTFRPQRCRTEKRLNSFFPFFMTYYDNGFIYKDQFLVFHLTDVNIRCYLSRYLNVIKINQSINEIKSPEIVRHHYKSKYNPIPIPIPITILHKNNIWSGLIPSWVKALCRRASEAALRAASLHAESGLACQMLLHTVACNYA